MNIKILTEDTYGESFFRELVKRLKNDLNISKDIKVDVDKIQGICSIKMTRQINIAIGEFDKTIVVVDGDRNS